MNRVLRVNFEQATGESGGSVVFNLDSFDLTTRDHRELFIARLDEWLDRVVIPQCSNS